MILVVRRPNVRLFYSLSIKLIIFINPQILCKHSFYYFLLFTYFGFFLLIFAFILCAANRVEFYFLCFRFPSFHS
jgi:hypothetical protein